jgi:hypothetical protein
MLGLYAGGDLPSADASKIEAHLAGCESCRAELEGFRRAMTALQGAGFTEESLPAADASYWHDLDRRLRGRTVVVERLSVSGWWFRVPRIALQAAVVVVVAGALVWLGTLDHGTSQKVSKSPSVALEPGRKPFKVFVRQPYQQAEAFLLPAPDNDTMYGDTGHVVSPGDIRRFSQQVLPASAEEIGKSSRF